MSREVGSETKGNIVLRGVNLGQVVGKIVSAGAQESTLPGSQQLVDRQGTGSLPIGLAVYQDG